MGETKVAIFIDTENLPVRCAGEIIDIASGYGRLVERRAYGDFGRETVHPWIAACGPYALSLQTAVSSQSGKNGSDILLAIDVMECLGSSAIDLFCIASSDRDVGHLATRIRMRGKRAIGLGGPTASKLLRESFDDFVELNVGGQKAVSRALNVIPFSPQPEVDAWIRKALDLADLGPEEWLEVSVLGSLLRKSVENYKGIFGSKKLKAHLKQCAFIETQTHGTSRMQIRMKRSG